MNQRWRVSCPSGCCRSGLVLLDRLAGGEQRGASAAWAVANGPTVAPQESLPSHAGYMAAFLDYVEAGRVTSRPVIYDGGRNAVVEAADPDLDNRVRTPGVRVDLPGLAPELINSP